MSFRPQLRYAGLLFIPDCLNPIRYENIGSYTAPLRLFLRSVPGIHYMLQSSFCQVIASSYEKGRNSSALNFQLFPRVSSSCSWTCSNLAPCTMSERIGLPRLHTVIYGTDYFSYHLQSGVILLQHVVPDYCVVVYCNLQCNYCREKILQVDN